MNAQLAISPDFPADLSGDDYDGADQADFSRGVPSMKYARTGMLLCPTCRSRTTVRNSRLVSDIFREYHLECRNVLCGLCYKASLSLDYVIRPSTIQHLGPEMPTRIPTEAEVLAAADQRIVADPDQSTIFDFLNPAPETPSAETPPHHDPP